MTSVSAATLAIVVFLIPGYAASIGWRIGSRDQRDHDRGPIYQMLALALAASAAHLLFWYLVLHVIYPWLAPALCLVSCPAEAPVIVVGPAGPLLMNGDDRVSMLNLPLTHAAFTVVYVGVLSIFAGGGSYGVGWLVGTGRLKVSTFHGPIYPYYVDDGSVVFASVTTRTQVDERTLIYFGIVDHIGYRRRGEIDSIVLRWPDRSVMRFNTNSAAGDDNGVGGEDGGDSGAWIDVVAEATVETPAGATRASIFISGDEIANVHLARLPRSQDTPILRLVIGVGIVIVIVVVVGFALS